MGKKLYLVFICISLKQTEKKIIQNIDPAEKSPSQPADVAIQISCYFNKAGAHTRPQLIEEKMEGKRDSKYRQIFGVLIQGTAMKQGSRQKRSGIKGQHSLGFQIFFRMGEMTASRNDLVESETDEVEVGTENCWRDTVSGHERTEIIINKHMQYFCTKKHRTLMRNQRRSK